MTGVRTGGSALSEPLFADALFGSDGTADPMPTPIAHERFADPLTLLAQPRVAVAPGPGRAPAPARTQAPAPTRALTPQPGRAPTPAPTRAPTTLAPSAPRSMPVRYFDADAPSPAAPWAQTAPPRPSAEWAPPSPAHPTAQYGAAPRTSSYPRPQPIRQTRPATRPNTSYRPGTRLPQRPGGTRRKSGGAITFIVVVIFFLVMSGAGRQILDGLMSLLNR